MTFSALYHLEAHGLLHRPIIGVAVEDWSTDHFRTALRAALEAADEMVANVVFNRLARRLTYVQGDFKQVSTYEKLATALKGSSRPLYYLEIPPGLFGRPRTSGLGSRRHGHD